MIDHATDSNSVAKTYTWGLDLSGDLQGAGGVGGLLCVTENLASSTQDRYFPSYDANGNISEYVDDSDTIVAHYEYSPFGKITSSSGSKSSDFRHRFSTKYRDSETNLYYYGYRYYSSELGRWLSRDPIEEEGGLNLYGMTNNSPIIRYDSLGLMFLNEGNGVDVLDELVMERKCPNNECGYELSVEGDPSLDPIGQNQKSRKVREVSKSFLKKAAGKIGGKLAKKAVDVVSDVAEIGAYETATRGYSSLSHGTYQISVSIEGECDCEGWFSGGENYERFFSITPADIKSYDSSRPGDIGGFSPGGFSKSVRGEIRRIVAQKHAETVGKMKKKCRKECCKK